MPHAGKRDQLPRPHTIIQTRRGTFRFYLGDCLDILPRLQPASLSAVVTSPPYNLGIRYRSYHDSLPREQNLNGVRVVRLNTTSLTVSKAT